jgi:hypothetical protein
MPLKLAPGSLRGRIGEGEVAVKEHPPAVAKHENEGDGEGAPEGPAVLQCDGVGAGGSEQGDIGCQHGDMRVGEAALQFRDTPSRRTAATTSARDGKSFPSWMMRVSSESTMPAKNASVSSRFEASMSAVFAASTAWTMADWPAGASVAAVAGVTHAVATSRTIRGMELFMAG